jgi:phosphate transport system substrate-binding protein
MVYMLELTKAMASWTCRGIAKNGQQHPNQNPTEPHEPYENFGSDCVICRLTREQVEGGSTKPPVNAIKAAAAAGILAALGFGAYKLLGPQSCPAGQQKFNGVCVVDSSKPSSPPNPTDGGGSPLPIKRAPTISQHRTLAEVPDVPNLAVRYGGSTSFAPLRSPEIVAKVLQAHPGFQLNYTEPPPGEKPGSGSGIRMLIEGQLSVAQSSRDVKDEEFDRAKTRGFTLEQAPVAIDGIALFVNPQLMIPGLSASQVKDIFTGQITNWSQVGGPNLAIKPFSRDPKDGGTPEYFEDKVLSKEPFVGTAQPYVRDTTDSLRKVASTPGGVGYATASEVCNQSLVKPLPLAKDVAQTFVSPCQGKQVNLADFANNAYPITRRLFVVIRRDGRIDEQAGVAYINMLLSDEGQQLVENAGLVPLRTR